MIDEPFAYGRSPIHTTNPCLRIVVAVITTCTVAVIHDTIALSLALCAAMACTALARLPLKPLGMRIGAAFTFVALVWLLVPFTYGGQPIATIGPLQMSREGVQLCLEISLKVAAILLAFISLVATMNTATLGHSLHRLGMPDKLVVLLLLAYRYIFVIEKEYQRLHRAARIRNFTPQTNLHTYRTYAYLVGMLFVRATERAARVHLAMKCRGFDGRFHALAHYAPTRWNSRLAIAATAMVLLILMLELTG